MLNMPVFLSGGTTGGMSAVTEGVSAMMQIVSSMLNTILENPVLAALFAVGFISIAIGVVTRLKHA